MEQGNFITVGISPTVLLVKKRVKQGEAVGRRIMARGGPERSGHVAGDLCELRRGGVRDGVGNVTSPVLG